MSDKNKISSAITSATATLKNAFGESTDVEGREEFRYLKEENLVKIYLSELDEKDLSAFFSDIPSSISKMRSSYLPTDLVRQITLAFEEIFSETVSDSIAIRESYENTFMRMMGMPKSDAISIGVSEITVVKSSGTKTSVSYEVVEKQILDQRQLPRIDRTVQITNDVYNFEDNSFEDDSINDATVEATEDQDSDALISITEALEELADAGRPNLVNLENEFYAYSYLLIPPVQDSRISECINEPSKIVPANFSNQRGHTINSSSLRTSMLESIIRIRKDRLSGYSAFSNIEGESGEEATVSTDNYGVLESLFIIRIRSALKALAIKLGKDTDLLREIYEQTGIIPVAKDLTTRDRVSPEDPRISPQNAETADGPSTMAIKGFTDLEKQRIIEDSMMALLDDNSKALDLQTQTQRKSSIKNSHVMSSLIGIIDLPRQRIREELVQEREDRVRQVDGLSDRNREIIDTSLGISKGVGVVDILVFILALFTMPEDHLVGLLSDLEYQRYLEEFAGAGDPDEAGITLSVGSGESDGLVKIQTSEAINMLTDYILAGYELFNQDLSNDDSGFNN